MLFYKCSVEVDWCWRTKRRAKEVDQCIWRTDSFDLPDSHFWIWSSSSRGQQNKSSLGIEKCFQRNYFLQCIPKYTRNSISEQERCFWKEIPVRKFHTVCHKIRRFFGWSWRSHKLCKGKYFFEGKITGKISSLIFFYQVFKENAAKELYMFATVAIDPKNIENVFSSVRNIIFTQAAEDLNLH